jgi:hypothetical protein
MAVRNGSYKTLQFSDTLSIVLDSDIQINYPELKKALDECKKGNYNDITLHECLTFEMQGKHIICKGYKVADGWFVSNHGFMFHVVPFDVPREKVLEVLYYVYHMAVTV